MDTLSSEPTGIAKTLIGAAHWVTETLIIKTLETWQPLTDKVVTPDDALAMLVNMSQLFDAVGLASPEEEVHEEVYRPCTGKQ